MGEIGYTREDRDLLIELRASVSALRQDIYTIKDGISASVVDHETRIRSIESSVTTVRAEKDASDRLTRYGGSVFVVIVGIIQFVISHFWK